VLRSTARRRAAPGPGRGSRSLWLARRQLGRRGRRPPARRRRTPAERRDAFRLGARGSRHPGSVDRSRAPRPARRPGARQSVWDALRDIGALHTRLVPGFVTDTRLDGDARIVTFANGKVARERIVDVSEKERRLVWAVSDPPFTHYNSAAQVFDDGPTRSRLV